MVPNAREFMGGIKHNWFYIIYEIISVIGIPIVRMFRKWILWNSSFSKKHTKQLESGNKNAKREFWIDGRMLKIKRSEGVNKIEGASKHN